MPISTNMILKKVRDNNCCSNIKVLCFCDTIVVVAWDVFSYDCLRY